MKNSNIKTRIEELRNEIRRHERLYFVEARPEISDQQFDQLMNELKRLETEHPEFITSDSPTQRVGEAITTFNTIRHRVPMLSIDNSYSENEIKDWIIRIEKHAGRSIFPIVAELKIDGVSGTFHYKDGKLIGGATRGNGSEGDIITQNIRTIRSLPLQIESKLDMDVRGEIFTPRSMLAKLNQERLSKGLEPFKNCRNLTAGTIKSLDPSVAAARGLQVMVYGIAQANEAGFKTHSESLEFLKSNGFKLNMYYQVCNSIEEIMQSLHEVEQKRHEFDFDIDGMVLKVDSLLIQEELGQTSKAPRWAIAFKYPQENAMSKLLDVKWQVGRSQLTPVAILEPVELGGTTVSRASLHNLDQIEEKDIRVGDQVLVEKAGYIIPYILESVKSARTGNEIKIRPPDKCPVCEHPTEIVSGLPDNATIVRCVNPACTGVSLRKILHFLTQMEIENLGPQLIEKLIKEDFISQIPDLFTLEPKELQALDRMGEKLATKIVSNISEGKKQRLSKLISALGIENVGKVIAEKIADHFNQSFDAFLNSNSDELKKIDGISDKVADNIIDYLDSKTNRELIDSIKAWWQGPGENLQNNRKSRTLQGKVFVVTGEAIIPRKKIEEIVKEHGGQIKTSVSTKTSHLLIGSKEGSSFKSNKKNKARELEIPIIDEIELFKMIGISGDENYW